MKRKRPRVRTGTQLPKPINVLLELAEKGTSASKRECLRLAELSLPERFPPVARWSRQALLRRIALDKRQAADLRRQCLVELLFGLSVGTQVQQALEVRVSRPRKRKPKTVQILDNVQIPDGAHQGDADSNQLAGEAGPHASQGATEVL